MAAADSVNREWDDKKPWVLAKDASKRDELHAVCSDCLRAFYVISVLLAPVMPCLASKCMALFQRGAPKSFDEAMDLPGSITLYQHLYARINPKQLEKMIEASKDTLAPAPASPAAVAENKSAASTPAAEPRKEGEYITIDDFAKLDLRIGKVLECGFVEGSDKLLRFLLDAGELGQRQIFSGIRASYAEPEKLVGRSVVFIANLAPRKMRFGISEGMILSAGFDGGGLSLLDADAGAQPGMPVK
jgi:methionyl-tRNA synthetase